MKKKYEKPSILFEDFTMSTNIANQCEVEANSADKNSCGLEVPAYRPVTVFTSTENGCTSIEASGEYNGVCYHVPNEANNLFAS